MRTEDGGVENDLSAARAKRRLRDLRDGLAHVERAQQLKLVGRTNDVAIPGHLTSSRILLDLLHASEAENNIKSKELTSNRDQIHSNQ